MALADLVVNERREHLLLIILGIAIYARKAVPGTLKRPVGGVKYFFVKFKECLFHFRYSCSASYSAHLPTGSKPVFL